MQLLTTQGQVLWSGLKTNNADDHPPFPIPGGGDHPTGLSLFTSILLAHINREKLEKEQLFPLHF